MTGTTTSEPTALFTDYPVWIWLTGVMTVGVGIAAPDTVWQRALFGAAGFVIVALAPVLTVVVDRNQRTLTLFYRSLLRSSIQVYPFEDILAIEVPRDAEDKWMSRIVLTLRPGQIAPLRSYVTTGWRSKERRAQRLRDAMRV